MNRILPPNKKYLPVIENGERILREICEKKLIELYGCIPDIIKNRLDFEITSLKKSDDITLMLIFWRVIQSEEIKHYMISARGTLSSSIVSYLLGITKANPLVPHYRCSDGHFYDFGMENFNVGVGADLPDRLCPVCGKKLLKDGFNLHSEFKFGFNGGDRISLTLNVPTSKKYRITKIIEEMPEINAVIDLPEEWRISKSNNKCKIIVPNEIAVNEVYLMSYTYASLKEDIPFYSFRLIETDFIDYITTLGEITDTNTDDIPFDVTEIENFFCIRPYTKPDDKEMAKFLSDEEKNIIKACSVNNISSIIKALALQYNKVWEDVACDLIGNNTASIKEIMSTQEDVYETFISAGINKEESFKLAYSVCFGITLTEEQKKIILEYNIPQWYVDSFSKIQYLFPRAHIVELLILRWKLAYFKINYPEKYTEIINMEQTALTIPYGVKTIAKYMIKDSVTHIVIPNSVTEIGDFAFTRCYKLTSVTIPYSVTKIGDFAFTRRKSLSNIEIPDSVKSIGENAFNGCKSLTDISIPKSVTRIDNFTFANCCNLANIELPNSITEIGTYAFFNCTNLKSIKIPSSVKEIGFGAFEACNGLRSLTIPNSVTKICDYAFSRCINLESITIPASVKELAGSSFCDCEKLKNINIDDDNKYYCVKNGTLFNNDLTKLIKFFDSNVVEYIIPNTVTKICDYAFSGCSNITSITITDSVKIIGVGAFSDCSNLKEITIYNPMTEIEEDTFFMDCPEIVIHGHPGSYAEKYAKDNNISFKLI